MVGRERVELSGTEVKGFTDPPRTLRDYLPILLDANTFFANERIFKICCLRLFLMVRVAGLEPAASPPQTERSTKLSYTRILMVEKIGIEPMTFCSSGRHSTTELLFQNLTRLKNCSFNNLTIHLLSS